MLKNKETPTFSRDQHNQRINKLENTNYNLFSNQINLVARPEADICKKQFQDKMPQSLSRNTPLIIQPRPIGIYPRCFLRFLCLGCGTKSVHSTVLSC